MKTEKPKTPSVWAPRITLKVLERNGITIQREVIRPKRNDVVSKFEAIQALRKALQVIPRDNSALQGSFSSLRLDLQRIRRLIKQPYSVRWMVDGVEGNPIQYGAQLIKQRRALKKPKADSYQPNRYLLRYMRKRIAILLQGKGPATGDRHVGVELEFLTSPNSRAIEDMKVALLPFAQYLQWKGDGSVRGLNNNDTYGMTGHELTICVPLEQAESVVRQVCEILTRHDARVNTTCGLHVHLDMRNVDPLGPYQRLFSAQQLLFAVQPESRQKNKYARQNKFDTLQRESTRGTNGHTRYHAINKYSLQNHKTLEVRVGAGSVEADKVWSWVELLHTIAFAADKLPLDTRISDLRAIGCPERLVMWAKERAEKFNTKPQVLRRRNVRRQAVTVQTEVSANV